MTNIGKLTRSLFLSTALTAGLGACATINSQNTKPASSMRCSVLNNAYECKITMEVSKGLTYIYSSSTDAYNTPVCEVSIINGYDKRENILTDDGCDEKVDMFRSFVLVKPGAGYLREHLLRTTEEELFKKREFDEIFKTAKQYILENLTEEEK